MDRALKLLVQIKATLRTLRASRRRPREQFTDATIVLVYAWSVLNSQPRCWACQRSSWPLKFPPGGLPSPARLSRRLRSEVVIKLLDRLEMMIQAIDPASPGVSVLAVDGRPLVIGNHSHDRHSGYGRAAGGKARGYKLHSIIDIEGRMRCWRLAPMNVDERKMAKRMVRGLQEEGYLLADSNYDSNPLFDAVATRGLVMITPRRYGSDKGMGKHRHSPARIRSRDLLENTQSDFGRILHALRGFIERWFGQAASTPELLGGLPAWVRHRDRVFRWVQMKLIAAELLRVDRTRKAIA